MVAPARGVVPRIPGDVHAQLRGEGEGHRSSGSSPPLAYFQTQGMLGGQDASSQWGFHTSMPQPAVIT